MHLKHVPGSKPKQRWNDFIKSGNFGFFPNEAFSPTCNGILSECLTPSCKELQGGQRVPQRASAG